MLTYERVKPLKGESLNYEVVGGSSAPTTFKKENTIWVKPTVLDIEAIADAESLVDNTRLGCYINNSTGVVVKPNTNDCRIRYFPCITGHQYNFKLSDGQTVIIAWYNNVPVAGATGTILHGIGNTNAQATLDYTVTAPDRATYLAIWYYDSSKNSKVIDPTITDITKKNEILKLLSNYSNASDVKNHAFGYNNPWLHYVEKNHIHNSMIIEPAYLTTNGNAVLENDNTDPCYIENYIPVKYGTNYTVNYTLSESKSMWLRITEYIEDGPGNYTFKGYTNNVDNVAGTSKSFTYTPSATNVTAVRISWRSFSSFSISCNLDFIEPSAEECLASVGDIWFQTDINKAPVNFNAIKLNGLIIYPYICNQWNGVCWKRSTSYLFSNKGTENTLINVYADPAGPYEWTSPDMTGDNVYGAITTSSTNIGSHPLSMLFDRTLPYNTSYAVLRAGNWYQWTLPEGESRLIFKWQVEVCSGGTTDILMEALGVSGTWHTIGNIKRGDAYGYKSGTCDLGEEITAIKFTKQDANNTYIRAMQFWGY